jgi:hypothetical protein
MLSPIKDALKEAEKSSEMRSSYRPFNESGRQKWVETRQCMVLNHFDISVEVERGKQWISPYNVIPFIILDRTRLARLETRLCTLMNFQDVPLTSHDAKLVKNTWWLLTTMNFHKH